MAGERIDQDFIPPVLAAGGTVRAIARQPDGRILLGGDFTVGSGGSVRSHLVRLNPDGSIDASLDAGLDAPVTDVALQADGRAILTGEFKSSGLLLGICFWREGR